MQVHKVLIMLVITAFTTGCVTYAPEPTEGPRAKMRFKSYASGWNVIIKSHSTSKCEGSERVAILSGIALKHNRQTMGMPLGEGLTEKEFTEVYIPANKPYIFTMGEHHGSVYTGYHHCDITMTFTPQENHMYETVYAHDEGKCGVGVFEIVKNQKGEYESVKVESAYKNNPQCLMQ